MAEARVILVAPAAPGSKGDEGMIRGALALFRNYRCVITDFSDIDSWLDALKLSDDERARITAVPGSIRSFESRLEPGDVLFFLGADVIDGSYGAEYSLERLDLATEALLRGHQVYIACSFRLQVVPEVRERFRLMPEATVLLRDDHSLRNFHDQTGLWGQAFPDLSFFCPVQNSSAVEAAKAEIAAARRSGPVIGLNFSEHSFRSFYDDHSDANRKFFVACILDELARAHPDAFFVLLSNDRRGWENHPSDEDYQDLAVEWIATNLGAGRALKVDPEMGYGGNIVVLEAVDLLVTGRMHLALAAFRAGTVPLLVMGTSAAYTSIDKMRGVCEKYLGTTDAVISAVERIGADSTRFLAEREQFETQISHSMLQQDRIIDQEAARLLASLKDNSERRQNGGGDLGAKLPQVGDEVATMTALGDHPAGAPREAASSSVRKGIERLGLRGLLLLSPVLPARTSNSLRRSLRKRQSIQFQDQGLSTPGGEGSAPSADDSSDVTMRDKRFHVFVLRALAACVAPVSARTAARFRRSADKRDLKKVMAWRRVQAAADWSDRGEGKAPATDSGRARRILVADYRLPRPDISAGEQGTFGIVADLCAVGFEVVFCAADMADIASYRQNLEALGATVITAADGYYGVEDYVRAEGARFGTFYLIRVDVAEIIMPTVLAVAPQARVVFLAPDLYFLRESRAAELSGDPAMRAAAEATRRREVTVMSAVDHVALVSPAEVPFLAPQIAREKISIFPALYSTVNDVSPGYAARQHMFFLGGFKHPPNVDAVKWFVEQVWPRVHAALPSVEFHIVGAEAPDDVQALAEVNGVRHIGYVPDLDPVLAAYRLSVAPLRYGAGIKGKVSASLGAGAPSVCTTIAAEGMGIVDGLHALIRDEPDAFADAIIALYQDEALWRRLSDNGRVLVRENFSAIANRSALLRMLDRAWALPLDLYIDYCRNAEPDAFPVHDANTSIDVSIIVPAYNKWELTRTCLNAVLVAGRATGLRYEVILADDGSTDATVDAAQLYPGLRVVRQKHSRGFLLNCNDAAAHARGRHLLFLNNDTVVMPDWLGPLVRALDEDPRAAIAGSKLLYPDGTIQEAGSILFSDGSTASLGAGRAWHTLLYSISREADYVCGASMLVRGTFWREVGGFDERYAPAYCEDPDLAMTARDRGYRALHVPESQVVHFEHGSYSDEGATRPRELIRANGVKLRDKWRATLAADHMPPGVPLDIAAARAERQPSLAALERRRAGALNILYFSPFPSHPDNHGNQANIQAFGRKFRKMGHKVHFALLESDMYDAAALAIMQQAWDSCTVLPNRHPLVANGKPISFDGWYEEGLGERIRILCSIYDIDVVFCSYVFQSKLLDYVPAHILKVIDTHDKMGNRYEMLRRNGQPLEFFSCTPEEEGAYLRRADIVVARRAEEAEYFNWVMGRDAAIVIPYVEAPRADHRSFARLANVGTVASANHINLAMTLQFLRAIERVAGTSAVSFIVHIAGHVRDLIGSLPAEEQALFHRPWVRIHGFVPDIGAFYEGLDVVVSPVTMGTGNNVKTVQAMAQGMPVLTTINGSKGIETDEPMHRHEDLDALAASLFRLEQTPAELERLAATSRRCYQILHDDAIRAMTGMFAAVKQGPPRPR